MFLVIGGVAALLILALECAADRVRSRRPAQDGDGPPARQQRLTLAGQWSALGIAGFAAVWKFTPLGLALAATLPTSG